jgi:hypothetical protein
VLKRVLVLLVVIGVAVVGYGMLRGGSSPGDTVHAPSGYTYQAPKDWPHRAPCDRHPFTGAGHDDDGCTRPDPNAEGGAYLVSFPVAAGRTTADVVSELSLQVSGYRSCTGEGGCLRSTAHPDQRGDLHVQIINGRAIGMLCLRTDVFDVARGCDVVWNSIKPASPTAPASRRGAARG